MLFIVRKIFVVGLLYLVASLGVFLAVKAMPGDPVMLRFSKYPDPERVALERERLGLNLPLPQQFVRYQKHFLSGSWGRSLSTGRLVRDDVAAYFPATLELALSALVMGALFGVTLSLLADSIPNRFQKTTLLSISQVGLVVPIFWIGLLALGVGALLLNWFPLGGRFDFARIGPPAVSGFLIFDSLIAMNIESLRVSLWYLALPSLCLSVYPAANVSSVLFARLQEPGVEKLKIALAARGFSKARVYAKHMLRVASPPVVIVVGTTFGGLLGGAFLTETVFSWPGIGRYLVTAILERDVYVVENLLLFLIMLVVVVASISDVLAKFLDPEPETSGGVR
ncbi:ABC transporter permease [Puniceicoccaceae bacterium K14]|nr:ABC transporter permease [Puniceicoccaceae bacterium K14]